MKLRVDLSRFRNDWYDPGAGFAKRAAWHLVNAVVLQNPANPSSKLKRAALRLFGAKIGRGVVIKPNVNVKYPWRLEVGDYAWIGEGAWIDNLADVKIGRNACLSQGAYILTGNHDYSSEAFDLKVGAVTVEDGAWVGAKTVVCPGVTCGSHSVLAVGSIATKDLEPYTIYQGNPAKPKREREIG